MELSKEQYKAALEFQCKKSFRLEDVEALAAVLAPAAPQDAIVDHLREALMEARKWMRSTQSLSGTNMQSACQTAHDKVKNALAATAPPHEVSASCDAASVTGGSPGEWRSPVVVTNGTIAQPVPADQPEQDDLMPADELLKTKAPAEGDLVEQPDDYKSVYEVLGEKIDSLEATLSALSSNHPFGPLYAALRKVETERDEALAIVRAHDAAARPEDGNLVTEMRIRGERAVKDITGMEVSQKPDQRRGRHIMLVNALAVVRAHDAAHTGEFTPEQLERVREAVAREFIENHKVPTTQGYDIANTVLARLHPNTPKVLTPEECVESILTRYGAVLQINEALKAQADRVTEILGSLAPGGSVVNMAIAAREVISALKAQVERLTAPVGDEEQEQIFKDWERKHFGERIWPPSSTQLINMLIAARAEKGPQ